MRGVAIAALLSLIAGSDVALAADLPQPMAPPQAPAAYVPAPAPVYNWGGIYVGINGGYGFASGSDVASISGNTFGLNGSATGTGNLQGPLVGGTIGANFQSDQFVFGVEGDWDWSGQSKTDSVGCGVGCSVSESFKLPWLATLRGRVGYAFDRVLVYGTAGGAIMNATDTVTGTAGGVTATLISLNDTAFGWTAGAGVEFGITQNITGRVEYLFVSAKPSGTATVPALIGGGTATETATISDSLIRAGLNFKFSAF